MDDFRIYGLTPRILYRVKLFFDKINPLEDSYLQYRMSRDTAKRLRKEIISRNGKKIVSGELRNEIKDYCKTTLGSKAYWPWLAYYTELKGEFKKGWIPDDYYRFKIVPELSPDKYKRFSIAKAIDSTLFGESVVKSFVFRSNGHYYDNNKLFKTQSEVKKILYKLDDEIIVKPDDGVGGIGIIFAHSKELNFEELSPDRNLVFQKVVKQHDIMNGIYPHSVNTFRVSTIIDKTGKVRVLFLIIRSGHGGNRVDNLFSGGGWVFVNRDGTVEPHSYDMHGLPLGTKHPDTGTVYSELKIPFIDKICKLCKNAHSRFPFTRLIGWDVFINRDGNPKLLEWNASNPFFMPVEAHFGPLLNGLIDI